MDDETSTTEMIHWECYACGQEATCVQTDAASEAWQLHMTGHLDPTYYGQWRWKAHWVHKVARGVSS